ncbi:MAG: DUF4288 domain-containing protein [Cytophagales bacterium]|mgnify:CR=1 FL=1|nr:DUF4288 domain-containing protein [Cytophagales bacterium]
MNWYVAKIIFRITTDNVNASQFDEHLRLIEAASFEEALLKARILGITEEDQHIHDQPKTARWEFVNVAEVIPIREIRDGMELYSQIHETAEAKSYIHRVHQKALALQLNPTER